jgi:muconolactone delta-isomerase
LGRGLTTHPCEKIAVTKTHEVSLAGEGKWRQPWQCLRIGTWNVLTLYRPRASAVLKQELKRDAERLGIRSWRTKAMDRDGQRLVTESAKTVRGL